MLVDTATHTCQCQRYTCHVCRVNHNDDICQSKITSDVTTGVRTHITPSCLAVCVYVRVCVSVCGSAYLILSSRSRMCRVNILRSFVHERVRAGTDAR